MTKQQPEKTMTDQIESILTDIAFGEAEQHTKEIHQLDEEHIQVKSQLYRIVLNYREGFQLEAFENRYQEFFEKYDFIVGDWGYEQLRLRGFYQVNQRKVPRDQTIVFLDDYLKEYCNFGCQYFVLAKEEALEKYEQLATKQKNRPSLPKSEDPSKPVISTKPLDASPAANRKPRRQQPRSNKRKVTSSLNKSDNADKLANKEDFQIKNPAKSKPQKPMTSKAGVKDRERKIKTETHQTKQNHTTKKGSFVIKQNNPKSE